MTFYSVQLREKVEVPDEDVQVVIMKNGKRAARASVERDGKTIKLFRILGKEDIARLEELGKMAEAETME